MRQMTVCVVVVLGVLLAADARAQDDQPAPPGGHRVRHARLPVRASARRRSASAATGCSRGPTATGTASSTDQLTLGQKDFNAPGFAADVGLRGRPPRRRRRRRRLQPVDETESEYRDFVDNNRLPITQTTRLRTIGHHRQRQVRAGRARARGEPAGLGAAAHRALRGRRRRRSALRSRAVRRLHRLPGQLGLPAARSRRRAGRRWRRRSRAWTSGC